MMFNAPWAGQGVPGVNNFSPYSHGTTMNPLTMVGPNTQSPANVTDVVRGVGNVQQGIGQNLAGQSGAPDITSLIRGVNTNMGNANQALMGKLK